MTFQKTQIQNLIAEIDTALNKASPRLPWVVSSEINQQRQLLEKTRSYLVSVQQMMEVPLVSGAEDISGAPNNAGSTPAASAQQVLQAVLQEMTYLRTQMVQPMRTEVISLQQQREQLLQEVKTLEIQQLQQTNLPPQPAADLMQELMERLQATLSEQIRQTLTQVDVDNANAYLLEGTDGNTNADMPRLSPANRLRQFESLQSQSDQLLLKLDSTLRVVFESLQSSIESYQDSLAQGLDKMHNLGQQGEVIFTALINHLAQQLSEDASAHIEANRLARDEQAQLSAAQTQLDGSEAVEQLQTSEALNLDDLDLDIEVEDEDLTLLQLDEEITQFQLEDDEDEDVTVLQVGSAGRAGQEITESTNTEQDDALFSLLNPEDIDNEDETTIEIGPISETKDAQSNEDIDALYESLFGASAIAPRPDTQASESTPTANDNLSPSSVSNGIELETPNLNSDLEITVNEEAPPLDPDLEGSEPQAPDPQPTGNEAELASPTVLAETLFDGLQITEAFDAGEASSDAPNVDTFFGEAGADAPLDPSLPPPTDVIESLTDLLPENADSEVGNRLLSATELLDALDTQLSADPGEESWTEEGFIPAPPEEQLLSDDTITDDGDIDLNLALNDSVLQALNEDLLGLEGLEGPEQSTLEQLDLPSETPTIDQATTPEASANSLESIQTGNEEIGSTLPPENIPAEMASSLPEAPADEPILDLSDAQLPDELLAPDLTADESTIAETALSDLPSSETSESIEADRTISIEAASSDLLSPEAPISDLGAVNDLSLDESDETLPIAPETPPNIDDNLADLVEGLGLTDDEDAAPTVPNPPQETIQSGALAPETLTSETLTSETLGIESTEATWTLSDLIDSESTPLDSAPESLEEDELTDTGLGMSFDLENLLTEADEEAALAVPPPTNESIDLMPDLAEIIPTETDDQAFNLNNLMAETEFEAESTDAASTNADEISIESGHNPSTLELTTEGPTEIDSESNLTDISTVPPESSASPEDSLPDLSLEGLDDSDFSLPDFESVDSEQTPDEPAGDEQSEPEFSNLLDNLDLGTLDPFENDEEDTALEMIEPGELVDSISDFEQSTATEADGTNDILDSDSDSFPEAVENDDDIDRGGIPADTADETPDFSFDALEENVDLDILPATDEAAADPDFSFDALEENMDLDILPAANDAESDFPLEAPEESVDLEVMSTEPADDDPDFSFEALEANTDFDIFPVDATNEAPEVSFETPEGNPTPETTPSLDTPDEQAIEPIIPDDVMADFSADLELPEELAQELSTTAEEFSVEPSAENLLAELPELTLPDFDQVDFSSESEDSGEQTTDIDLVLPDPDRAGQPESTSELDLPEFEALTDLETAEAELSSPSLELPDLNNLDQPTAETDNNELSTNSDVDPLDFGVSTDNESIPIDFKSPTPDLEVENLEFELEDIEFEDIDITPLDNAPEATETSAPIASDPFDFDSTEFESDRLSTAESTELDATVSPETDLENTSLTSELRTPLPEVDIPPLDLPAAEQANLSEINSLFSPEATSEAGTSTNEDEIAPAIVPPPTPQTRTTDPNHAWFLGIDFGTTGLSAVLLDQVTDEVYPVYWHNLTGDTGTPERIFRLPAIVDLNPTQSQSSSQWQIQTSGLAAIQTAWQRNTQPATATTAGGLLLRQLKPLLKVGIPYRPTDGRDWQPTVQWSIENQIPLQLVQAGLSDLLQNLQTPNACAALGLEAMPLQAVLQQLTGVIMGYPPNWPDTYCFNLREAVLATGLVNHPDQIFFIEEAIATVLSGLPNPAKVDSEESTNPSRQQALYNSNWQGGTVVICAGATLTELALVDLPTPLNTLSYTSFALKTLNYAGDAIDQDIICQLLLPAGNRQTVSGRGDNPNPFNRYASGGWNWQPNLPAVSEADWDSLQLDESKLPGPGEPDLIRRRQLQQHLEASLLGQSLIEAARYLKLILQHQGQFQLELGNQRWTIRRRELESQIFLPYIQRVNRHINMLMTQTGLAAQGINQVICTGGSASLPAFARWLRQKFPNATIIQDTYPSDRPASCSRVAYGLVNLVRYPNVLDITRQQYSDYFLLRELLRHLPEMPLPVSGIMHRLEQHGLNTQACQMHLLALLEGHLPPGMVPTETDRALLNISPSEMDLYRTLISQPLFTKQGGQTYVPNPVQAERLIRHLDTLLADKQQQLEEPLIAHLGARIMP